MMKSNKILITGFSGSGKSYLLQNICAMTPSEQNIYYRDLDIEIEKENLSSIAFIVKNLGWESFRQMESDFFWKMMNDPKIKIIALGGGTLLRQNKLLIDPFNPMIIWLNESFANCWNRIKQLSQEKPLVLEGHDHLLKIYNERLTHYRSWANLEITEFSESSLHDLSLYILNLLR